MLVVGRLAAHPARDLGRGPESLVVATRGAGDHRVREGDDLMAAAVILLQGDLHAAREVVLEAEDASDVRPAEAVDRLVVVADDAEIPPGSEEGPEQVVLLVVGILVFVDEQVRPPPVIAGTDALVPAEYLQ